MTQPTWTDVVQSLVAFVALLVAVGLGWWQSHLQHNSLKFELFKKRYEIWLAFKEYLGTIASSAEVDFDATMRMIASTRAAEFFFPPEVPLLINKTYEKAMLYRTLKQSNVAMNEQHQLLEWLVVTASQEADQVFGPHLRLVVPIKQRVRELRRRLDHWIEGPLFKID